MGQPRAAFGLDRDENGCGPGTVREVLAALANETIERVSFSTGCVHVRVLAPKYSDTWLTCRSGLVAAFAALAAYGGSERLEVFGFRDGGPEEGFRLEVDGSCRLTRLSSDDFASPMAAEALAALALEDPAASPLRPEHRRPRQ
jgi:hypothetical protein